MRNKSLVLIISILMLMPMLSGCIGGDGDTEVTAWDGDINDLLLTVDDLGEEYDVETEYYTDPEEFADDVTDLEDHGFQEGAMSDFALLDLMNMVIGAQMVLRFDVDKMDEVLDDFRSNMDLEDDDSTTVEEIDLGSYGEETLALRITSQDLEGFGAYAIGFIKNDIMVFIMLVGAEDNGVMIKDLTEKIEDKF